MAFSRDTYIADGVTKQYAIVFDDGYLNKDDISVYLMPTEQGGANEPINYIFINDYLIELEYAPASGREIVIEREADASKRLVEFTPSFIRAADLNVMYKHLLYLSQGVYDGRFSEAFGANIDMNNYRIINVGTPVEDNDAARWGDIKDVLPARDETLIARDEAVNAASNAKNSETICAQAQVITTANRDEVTTYRVEIEELATETEENRQQAQAAASTASEAADATAADRVAVEANTGLAQAAATTAINSAQTAQNDATIAETKAMEAEASAAEAAASAASVNPENKLNITLDNAKVHTVTREEMVDNPEGGLLVTLDSGVYAVELMDALTTFSLIAPPVGTYGQIRIFLWVGNPFAVNWGVTDFYNGVVPDISAGGFYAVYYDYDVFAQRWVCGVSKVGE